jgi:flagellar motor switch protein FliM
MTEVLSQDEIDQLLTAINAGEREPDDFRPVCNNRKIKIYDFKRPDVFTKEQIRYVSIEFEKIVRTISQQWSKICDGHDKVHVHVASVDSLTSEEYIRSIPCPTYLRRYDVPVPKRTAELWIEGCAPLVTATVQSIFHGQTDHNTKISMRMTKLEEKIGDEVMDAMERNILGVFESFKFSFSTEKLLEPMTRPFVEMGILVTFEVRVGDVEGVATAFFPQSFLIPWLKIEKPKYSYWRAFGVDDQRPSELPIGTLESASLPLRAVALEGKCKIERLLEWIEKKDSVDMILRDQVPMKLKAGDAALFDVKTIGKSKTGRRTIGL